MPPRAAEMNEPVVLVGRVLPAAEGSNCAGDCGGSKAGVRRRRLWFERIQHGAERKDAGGSRAGTGAHAQYRTAFQVRHERHNAAPRRVFRHSHAVPESTVTAP